MRPPCTSSLAKAPSSSSRSAAVSCSLMAPRFSKWELTVDGRLVEYEVSGRLTISDSIFSVEAALDGIGLAYTFDALVVDHLKSKRLKRVLSACSPTFPGFYLYYPSRRQQPPKLKALVEYVQSHSGNG